MLPLDTERRQLRWFAYLMPPGWDVLGLSYQQQASVCTKDMLERWYFSGVLCLGYCPCNLATDDWHLYEHRNIKSAEIWVIPLCQNFWSKIGIKTYSRYLKTAFSIDPMLYLFRYLLNKFRIPGWFLRGETNPFGFAARASAEWPTVVTPCEWRSQ